MADQSLATIGRFSSQMLTNLGVQRTVVLNNGVPVNSFKYNNGTVVFPSPGSILESDLGAGVVGNYSPDEFNAVTAFFLSRGTGPLYAGTMAGLAIDMAAMTNVDPIQMLEVADANGQLIFQENTYRALNNLRDPGNQVGIVTPVDNRFSLQASQIRP